MTASTDFEVAVDGGAISCTSAGAGRLIILLHGWTLDRRMWAPQIEALAPNYRVIALDRRGFGRSSAPADLSREADDVARVLDSVGAQSTVIVGMSQAGRVALDFAQRFADRTDALVLHGAPHAGVTPGPGDDEAIPMVEYTALVRAGRLQDMKRRWRTHALMRTLTADAAARVEAMLADYEGRDLTGESMAAIEAPDPAQIMASSLVITGALDTSWRRRASDVLAQQLPTAQRREIEGAGHLCNLCAPEAYNALFERFLAPELR